MGVDAENVFDRHSNKQSSARMPNDRNGFRNESSGEVNHTSSVQRLEGGLDDEGHRPLHTRQVCFNTWYNGCLVSDF